MRIVDLHPEELLDKHARGALSEPERARLNAHVATCAVCRFELLARVDFERDASSVFGAPRAAGRTRHTGRPRRRAWVFGLAAALIGGMSFAALSSGMLRSFERTPAAAGGPARRTAAHALPAAASPAAPASNADAVTPAGPEAPSLAPAATSASAAIRESAPERGEPRTARATPSAAELFRTANAARRTHDADHAIALYRELESRYPHSEEARVSYATLGSLLLDRGDPRAALDGFNRYLSHGETALGEEALVGRALASRKLGARDGEIAAWQEILRRFPRSIHAELARARLADLGER